MVELREYLSSPMGNMLTGIGLFLITLAKRALDLAASFSPDFWLQGHVMGKYGLGGRNDNWGALFERRACYKIICAITTQTIRYFVTCSRFKSCLMEVGTKRGNGIDLQKDHHLMVTYVNLRVASSTSCKVGEFLPCEIIRRPHVWSSSRSIVGKLSCWSDGKYTQ